MPPLDPSGAEPKKPKPCKTHDHFIKFGGALPKPNHPNCGPESESSEMSLSLRPLNSHNARPHDRRRIETVTKAKLPKYDVTRRLTTRSNGNLENDLSSQPNPRIRRIRFRLNASCI